MSLTRLRRSLILVSGPDRVGFLDNLLTQDVTKLEDAAVQYGALLSPQGKVLTDLILWLGGGAEGIVLDVDPARADDLLRRLSMYKLRAQVTLEDVTTSYVALWTDQTILGGLPDPRFPDGALGWRALSKGDTYGGVAAGDAEYEALRLRLGVPDLARDAEPEEVFALEALLEELHGVDFKKGCFVGQENVSRMKRRATTRKKFCPIVFDGDAPPRGALVTAGGAELGTVRSGAEGRALALLRLDRALDALNRGEPLIADGRTVKLAPPDWLILPKQEPAGAQD